MIYQLMFLISIVSTAEVNLQCAPGEVTKPYTFTFNCSIGNDAIVLNKNGHLIATYSESTCTILDPDIATCSGTTLTIKAVNTQSRGNYSCEGAGFNCGFNVYAKPDMVTCQDPELQTETNEVAVVGTVLGVYPNPVCQFSWFIDNTSRIIQKSIVEYKNLTGSGDPSYFNQTCSFKVPARNFIHGKHQFQLLAYPDVTGQDNDTVYGKYSAQTSSKYVADPIITLACSETSIQQGNQFSCTCKETANTFILPNTTLFYGGAKVSSALQQVTANVTARRNTSVGPTIFIVEANNKSGQIILEKNSSVSISCQAEGNPSPSLSLRKDGREIKPVSDSTHKSNRALIYNKVMAECTDTGVYMCHAETGQAATNKTVAVYVKCAQQFRDPDSLSQSYKEQVNGTVWINVPVFGYPEPTVTLNSDKYILSSESYKFNYTKQEPPYGTVSLVINIKNASYFQNYSLNINNTEGPLTYSFEIVDGVTPDPEKGDSPPLDVGAIVGGVVAAVLVIIIICVIVYLVKRKGAPCRESKDENAINSMHTIYENDASGSRHVLEELPEAKAPESPHYEEIIDFRSDMPEKSVHYANQISNARDEEVEYENTVSGL